MSCHPLPSSHEAHPLIGGGLNGDPVGGEVKRLSYPLLHPWDKRIELRCLSHDGCVYVAHPIPSLPEEHKNLPKQYHRVGSGISRISVREVVADISQSSSSEEGISDGMQQHISIRVTQKTPRCRDLYASQDQLTPLRIAVDIVAVAYSYASSAHQKSVLRVTRSVLLRGDLLSCATK